MDSPITNRKRDLATMLTEIQSMADFAEEEDREDVERTLVKLKKRKEKFDLAERDQALARFVEVLNNQPMKSVFFINKSTFSWNLLNDSTGIVESIDTANNILRYRPFLQKVRARKFGPEVQRVAGSIYFDSEKSEMLMTVDQRGALNKDFYTLAKEPVTMVLPKTKFEVECAARYFLTVDFPRENTKPQDKVKKPRKKVNVKNVEK
jgi:hypothetical protein